MLCLIELDGTPDKSPPWRQRHGRRIDGRGPCGGGRRRPAAMAPPAARRAGVAAAAGDPDLRRRRPRRRGASTSRTSWSCPWPRAPSPRRSTGPPRSTARRAPICGRRGRLQGVADEGGYWPAFRSNEEALERSLRAIGAAGLRPGREVAHLARRRGLGFRTGRRLPARAGRPHARPRTPDRDARRVDRPLSRSCRSRTRSPRTTGMASCGSPRYRPSLPGRRRRLLVHRAERVSAAARTALRQPC